MHSWKAFEGQQDRENCVNKLNETFFLTDETLVTTSLQCTVTIGPDGFSKQSIKQ
jgi:hypothetical protein